MRKELVDKLYHNRATVIRVIDADTLEVSIDLGYGIFLVSSKENPVSVRLARVDAWEMKGEEKDLGVMARDRVCELLDNLGSDVLIRTKSKDSFGRWLADVWLSDGKNLSDLLLLEGHAKEYSRG